MLLYIFLLFCTLPLTQAEAKTLSFEEQKWLCSGRGQNRTDPEMPTRTEKQNEDTEVLFCLFNLDVPAEEKAFFKHEINMQIKELQSYSMHLSPFKLCLNKLGYFIFQEMRGHMPGFPACILSDEEFWRVEKVVRTKCDKEAWKDFIINSDRVRLDLCRTMGSVS